MTLTSKQLALILTALDSLAENGHDTIDFSFEEIDGVASVVAQAVNMDAHPVGLVHSNLVELSEELHRRAAECNDGTEYGEGYADGYTRAAQMIGAAIGTKEALVF